jgi:hypothetical protein
MSSLAQPVNYPVTYASASFKELVSLGKATPVNYQVTSVYDQARYDRFLKNTDATNISRYACGASLKELVNLAETAVQVVQKNSPTHPEFWRVEIFQIKKNLAKAIQMKQDYYENHSIGRIVKRVLEFFGCWNNGNTAAIVAAEDFLLFWDSRCPVRKISDRSLATFGKYEKLDNISTEGLSKEQIYNYNPTRLIELSDGTNLDYKNLSQSHSGNR